MRAGMTKPRAGLLVCALVLLHGCLMEDTVTITKDGMVRFESMVTLPDMEKKLEPAAFLNLVASSILDLQRHKWKVEQQWISKDRPYQLKVIGTGKLSEVTGATAFYALAQASDRAYRLTFLRGGGGDAATTTLRVSFAPAAGVAITDSAGKPVQELDNPDSKQTVTILIK